MTYSKVLETERLILKLFDPTNPEHYTHQLGLANSEFIRRLFVNMGTVTKEGFDKKCALQKPAREICTNLEEGVEEPSHSCHLVFDKASGEFLGSTALNHRKETGFPPDIGWGLHEEFGGKGYATEAARRVLRFWKEEIGVKEVWAVTGRRNWASRKICEKIGLENVGDFGMLMPDGKLEEVTGFMSPGRKKLEPGLVVDMKLGAGFNLPPKV